MSVKVSIPALAYAVAIDFIAPGLLEAKLSHRQKFRYFLVVIKLSEKPVLQNWSEWIQLREMVERETPLLDPFALRTRCDIEREVLTMGYRSDRRA